MKRSTLLLIVLVLTICKVYGQDTLTQQKFSYPKIRLGISPTALLHPMPAIQMSGDYGFGNGRFNLGLEAGYIYSGRANYFLPDISINDARGINTRLSIDVAAVKSDISGFYLGLALIRKKYGRKYRRWLNNRQEQFAAYHNVHQSRTYFALAYQIGILSHLGNGIYIDANVGLGTGKLHSKQFVGEDETTVADTKKDLNTFYFNLNLSYDLTFSSEK